MSNAGLVPVAIPSPVPLNPIPQPAQPVKSNANIIIVILLIALVVFCIFLFTKLNTQNKQIKELQNELQNERESNAKAFQLLQAIAQRVGVQQNEKGEIELLEDGQGEDGEEECDVGDEKQCDTDGVCRLGDEKFVFLQGMQAAPTPTPFFAKMFAQQRDFMSGVHPSSQPAAQVVVEDTHEATVAPTTGTPDAPKPEEVKEEVKEAAKDSGLDKVN